MLPERNSIDVWHAYLAWLIAHPDLHDSQEITAKFEQSIRNTGQGTEPLLLLYLTWTRSSQGLSKFRDLASRVVALPQVSEKVLTECLAIEEQEPKPSLSRRRVILEALVNRFKSSQSEFLFSDFIHPSSRKLFFFSLSLSLLAHQNAGSCTCRWSVMPRSSNGQTPFTGGR